MVSTKTYLCNNRCSYASVMWSERGGTLAAVDGRGSVCDLWTRGEAPATCVATSPRGRADALIAPPLRGRFLVARGLRSRWWSHRHADAVWDPAWQGPVRDDRAVQSDGVVQVDHHQFSFGDPTVVTLDPLAQGTVIDVGYGAVWLFIGITFC